jgi:hypothetical protein
MNDTKVLNQIKAAIKTENDNAIRLRKQAVVEHINGMIPDKQAMQLLTEADRCNQQVIGMCKLAFTLGITMVDLGMPRTWTGKP